MSDIEIIETTDGSEFEVEVFEAVPIIPDEVPHLDHNKLNNREISDQHPMSAITGLEKEIEDIKALKTVESNKIGVANYYEWDGGAAYDTFGYFVSLVTHNSTIKICDGGDIFGVTVGDAAFVGGQNQDVPRDNKYALVVTSGPVDVRCESDVEEGDYVICNGRGEAKKTTTECGYKVIAINLEKTNQYGTTYATIALGVQACTTDSLGKDLQALASRVGVNEQNIVLAINVSNQAYNKATEVVISNQTISEKVDTAVGKVDEMSTTVENMGDQVSKAQGDSARARAIAETAALSATAIKDEAIARANDAWAKADKVETEAYSLCAKIDKYSVGEYSQAYGLTFEQAQGILKPGMIYVPTKHIGETEYHTETYAYTNTAEEWTEIDRDESKVYYDATNKKYWYYNNGWKSSDDIPTYTRIFTLGYLYQWGWLPAYQRYGWITIDKNHQLVNYESMVEDNLAHQSVFFDHEEPAVVNGEEFGYWYTNGDSIVGTTGTYEPYTLYKWESDHWTSVATLIGNASNRMISEVYQTTNQITMGVVNPRGCIAALDARVTDTESEVTTLSGWKNGENQTAEAIIKQKTDENGASIVISALQKDEGDVVKAMANLVLNVAKDTDGNPTSNLVMSADNINFEAKNYSIDASKILLGGKTTFTTTEKDENDNDVTKIHGSHIATSTISADKIATDAIRSKNYKPVDGNDNPTTPTGTPPYSTDGTFLDLSNGALYSKNFAIDSDGSGHIGGWSVTRDAISKGVGGVYSGMCSVQAEEDYDDVTFTYSTDDETSTCTITGISPTGVAKIKIPSKIDKYSVVAIHDGAFESNKNLVSVTIDDGIETIGNAAFRYCDKLTSIKMPDSVTGIGKSAFNECTNLKSIIMSKNITYIGNFAFAYCYNITGIVIPDAVTFIGHDAFIGCKSLISVFIPTGVTTIEDCAFNGCDNLTIYCEVSKIPDTWQEYWNYSDCNIQLGCKKEYYNHPSLIASSSTSAPRFFAGHNTDGIPSLFTTRPNFLVLEDGSLYASAASISGHVEASSGSFSGHVEASSGSFSGHVEASSGNISNLKIQNGGLQYDINEEKSFSLNSLGLILEKNTAKIQVGDLEMGYDTAEKNTIIKTSGHFIIRGANSTQLEFMKKTGGNTISFDVAIYCRLVEQGNNIRRYNVWTEIESETAPLLYPFSLNLGFRLEERNFWGKYEPGDTEWTEPLITPAGETVSSTYQIITGIGDKLSFLARDGSWSAGMIPDRTAVRVCVHGSYTQDESFDNLYVTGNLLPSITSTNLEDGSGNGTGYNLGSGAENGAIWNTVYARNQTIQSSDREVKKDIEPLSDLHEQIFDALEPVSYKFKVNNNNRTHTGFIAQDVKSAVENVGLTTQDFAAYCEWEKDDGTIGCGLRYGEFIALCVNEIQKLKKRVNELEEKLDNTK